MNITLNFKAQFARDVEQGDKRQTIRPQGKRMAEVGDTLYFFSGMRTKNCRRLGQAICRQAVDLVIDTEAYLVTIAGERSAMSISRLAMLAKMDGFDSIESFMRFFRETYGPGVLEMRLYQW